MIDIKDNNSTFERITANIEESQKSRTASNYNKGLNYDEHKLPSKGFDKLMEQRGIDASGAKNAKQSFNKWAPKEAKNPQMAQDVTVKHTSTKGEKGYIYSTKGGKPATGNYVSPIKQSSPEKAKENLALPVDNKATQQNEVRVYGDQIRGTVAPQPQWSAEAVAKGDNVQRSGGGIQILSNGGYKTGAVKNVETSKADMKKSSAQMSAASKSVANTNNASGKSSSASQMSSASKSSDTTQSANRSASASQMNSAAKTSSSQSNPYKTQGRSVSQIGYRSTSSMNSSQTSRNHNNDKKRVHGR